MASSVSGEQGNGQSTGGHTPDPNRNPGSDLLKLGAPVGLIVVIAFFLTFRFVDPAPPSAIVLATGEDGGAYAVFGEAYRERLRAFEIDVALRSSAGTAENLELLLRGEADVAFVQGGVANAAAFAELETLGSLYYEPLWAFHRSDLRAALLTDFSGLRLAIGSEGSGTRAVAKALLAANGIEAGLVDLAGRASVDALLAGEIDVAFLIASPDSALVRELLLSDVVSPFSFRRAEAYTRTHRYLSHVTLPEGMIDYARNIPHQPIELVAPTAQLVVLKDLHPALVDLMAQSAGAIHGAGGVFEGPGSFPTPAFVDLELNPEARRYYEYGPPFLQRYLPFWLATMVDRLKVMLIPLLSLIHI